MNLQVGVKVIVKNDQGQYLLLQRSESVEHGGDGSWDIPGGRIDPIEPLMIALTREIKEETGMRLISEPKIVGAQDIFVESKDLHVVRLTYVGTTEGSIMLSSEHSDYKWVDRSELLDMTGLDPYVSELFQGTVV